MATPPHRDASFVTEVSPTADPGSLEPQPDHLVANLFDEVERASATWHDQFAVSISRASEIAGLREHQIRYFEELGALQPLKSGTAGVTRRYTISDVRRLRVLALLSERGFRAAEATDLVNAHTPSAGHAVERVLARERNAVADGFLLARLVSQLIDATEAILNDPDKRTVRVVEVLIPLLPSPLPLDSAADCYEAVRALRANCTQTLVAFAQVGTDDPPSPPTPYALAQTGRDDTTALFYSRDPQALPHRSGWQACVSTLAHVPEHPIIFVVEHAQPTLPTVLIPNADQAPIFTCLHALCRSVLPVFAGSLSSGTYRYRSDGYQIAQTRSGLRAVLAQLRNALFSDNPDSMAVLLIPNSLDAPVSLSILAHDGYEDDLAFQAKLDLQGQGQGLSGRAYRAREPFFSREATRDGRVEYAMEEHCHSAVAVPLALAWSLAPFGVLYIASKHPQHTIDEHQATSAVVLGSILSEVLGRWWLTRLRRDQEQSLHRAMPRMVRWIDSLDTHGRALKQALDRLTHLWQRIVAESGTVYDSHLTLIVLDIDRYHHLVEVHTTDFLPLTAQDHVAAAATRVLPKAHLCWFHNDHALLVLETTDADRAENIAQRIVKQVATVPMPLGSKRQARISVSAACRVMNYQDVGDLARNEHELHVQLRAIIEQLRAALSACQPGSCVMLR
ncbi:MerR family transcriptional regulator [Candidatus Gracilibacteria bacterium]|nr:MerR family transcriptional regulator [Candidatus Gracilibacteria bacterium]